VDALIRSASLQGFDTLVTELGADPVPLLLEAGLRPDLAADRDAYLPYRSLAHLVENASRELRCPDFGLRLAQYQGIEILGAVAMIARHAPTAADAMVGLNRYTQFYSTAFEVDLQPLDEARARYTFTIVAPRVPERIQVLELSLGVSLDLFRILLGDDFRPRRALLPHAAVAPPAVYHAFFDCPVTFDAEVCGFDIDQAQLARPRRNDDPEVRRLAERYLDTTAVPGGADLHTHVRELVGRLLPTGQATIGTVARHLGLHPRTLQRRLRDEGTTFEVTLDEVRRDLAEQYVCWSERPLPQIATMLGYTEQSTLSRACRRWFGVPPQRLRRGRPA
jgi:AraC-like DNA-binding protein